MTAIITKDDFSSGGLVWNKNEKKLLLVCVQNLSGHKVWTFPKGHPEAGETDETAAQREVREETGWDCAIEQPLMDTVYYYVHNNTRFHKTVRWFLMSPIKKVGTFMEEEILDCQWASLAEAKEKIIYDSDKSLIKKAEAVIL